MNLSTSGEQTAERSADDFLRAAKDVMANALASGLRFHWNVRRHEHVLGDGVVVAGTILELNVDPPCLNCGDGECVGEDDEEN